MRFNKVKILLANSDIQMKGAREMHEEFGDKIYGFTLCYKSKDDA